jgi:hypothetical protein
MIAGPSLDEFDSISPGTVLGVSERHTLRVAAVPGILRQTGLLRGGLGREWRQGRAKRHGELGTGMSGSLQIDSAAGAGAASNCRMSGGPQARPTVGLIHWQSFAKNFMFFVRRRRSAVGRVSDSYVYILDAMGALY